MPAQPNFWATRSVASVLLLPLSLLYVLGAKLDHLLAKPQRLRVPVISIGNVTVGGAGKTPTSIAITKLLKERGHMPHILSRGYGAKIAAPIRVNPAQHKSADVGDEALLLAQYAPTWVCPKRIQSGDAAVSAGANLVICDDALQHHALHKDINMLIIDGAYGIGNGWLLPAGPLRESLSDALARCDGVVLIGEDAHGVTRNISLPIFKAKLEPVGDVNWLKNTDVIAFAGIARPQKFYATLKALGATIRATHDFPDHHEFSESELNVLASSGTLVTTEKDWVRLSPEWQTRIKHLPVALRFDDAQKLGNWLEEKLRA